MKSGKNIKSYTTQELRAMEATTRTDYDRLDAITDSELERLIADDDDKRDMRPDWTKAKLMLPKARKSIHLRLEQEIIDFFKSQGRGHISRMQAVLKAYADAHRR